MQMAQSAPPPFNYGVVLQYNRGEISVFGHIRSYIKLAKTSWTVYAVQWTSCKGDEYEAWWEDVAEDDINKLSAGP